jgi:predicted acetyltransferase
MIRFAHSSDYDAIIALWNRCFGDDTTFTNWFFQNQYQADHTLLYVNGDKLCAMVQMLPYELQKSSDEIISVTYIYGACTAPEHRRKGLMAELLKESFRIDQQNGRAASILIPAEPWLFDFYRKYGYEAAFSVSNEMVKRDSAIVGRGAIRILTETDSDSLNACYSAHLNAPYLRRTKEDWKKQIQMFQDLCGMPLGWYDSENKKMHGYAFVWKNEDGLWAQEIIADEREQMLQMLLQYCSADAIKATFPGTEQQLGCIRYHDTSAVERGYFNLLFN